jgi:hypothetical protein
MRTVAATACMMRGARKRRQDKCFDERHETLNRQLTGSWDFSLECSARHLSRFAHSEILDMLRSGWL